jgi:hypothetical protein
MENTIKKGANIIELPKETDVTGATDANDILNQMSGGKSKSKSKVPLIDDKEFREKVDEVIELNSKLKDAESSYKLAESVVLARVRQEYDTNKGANPSYKIQGTKKAVLVSFKNQFKQIPLENKSVFQEVLKEDFSKFFTEVYELALKDTSVAKIQEIIDLVGAEKFKEVFEIKKSYIKAADNMNVLQFELPDEVKPMVEQYKGSVKI